MMFRRYVQDIRGQALVEILLAMALFALIAAGLFSSLVGGFSGINQARDYAAARVFAEEGIEKVRNIRDRAWNELTMAQSGVSATSGSWIFTGEGSVDRRDGMVRSVSFSDVCRDQNNEIRPCPAAYHDVHSKRVDVTVEWPRIEGSTSSLALSTYLTNWDSVNWVQSDWSLGPGQQQWQNSRRYASDDGQLQIRTAGQVSLARNDFCRVKEWSFDQPNNYEYDAEAIEVANSEARLRNQGESVSGISQPLFDEWIFDPNVGREPNIVAVSDTVFAVAYRGPGDDGILATISVGQDGQIQEQIIDQLIFEPGSVVYIDFIHVEADIYAISYRAANKRGHIKTVKILPDGTVGDAVLDTLIFEANGAAWSDMAHIRDTIFGIAYQGPGNDGFVKTFTIDGNGGISNQVIDVFEFDPVQGYNPRMVRYSDDVIAIAYRGPDNDGFIVTVGVDQAGRLTDNVVSRFEFDPANTLEVALVPISESIVAVAYRGPGDDGFIKTIAIQANGAIIQQAVDTLEFDPRNGLFPDITHITGDVYGAVTRSAGNDGYLTVFRITEVGDIGDAVIAAAEFTANKDATYAHVLTISEDTLLTVYQGPNSRGYLVTSKLKIDANYSNNGPVIAPTASFEVGRIGQWAVFEEVTTADPNARTTYQLSSDNGLNWSYWDGNAWVAAGANDRNTADVVAGSIGVFSTTTGSIMFRAFLESDGRAQVHLDTVRIGCTNQQYEIGSTVADEEWVTVQLQHRYQAPVVITAYQEQANNSSVSTRLRNITSSTFDVRLQQTQDQDIPADPVSYMVIEKGMWNINGLLVEAGYLDTNKFASRGRGWGQFEPVNFRAPFGGAPAVFHQIMTFNDPRWVTTWVRSQQSRTEPPDAQGMGIGLNGSKSPEVDHGTERIGWIAIRSNVSSTLNETPFEVRTLPDGNKGVKGHQQGCSRFAYSQQFGAPPIVFVSQLEMDGSDGSWAVICSNEANQVGIHAEEYDNGERSHTDEIAAFLSFANPVDDTVVQEDNNEVAQHGSLVSSAFPLGKQGSIQEIEWDEHIPECQQNTCALQLQVRAARNQGGVPAQWTPWYGATGPNTFFRTSTGSLIPTALNTYEWMQYRVEFSGDGVETPILQEVRVNYK